MGKHLEGWTVKSRRPTRRYIVNPVTTPDLSIEDRVAITAVCPEGHALPYEVTADEAVVRASKGSGVTIGGQSCVKNYVLDLGEWPSALPRNAS